MTEEPEHPLKYVSRLELAVAWPLLLFLVLLAGIGSSAYAQKKYYGVPDYMRGYFLESILEETKIIAEKPDNAYAYADRSSYYFLLGDYALATKDIRRAITLDPENLLHYDSFGSTLLFQGKLGEAYSVFSVGLAKEGDNISLLRGKAECLALLNQHSEALAILDTMISEVPDELDAYRIRGKLYLTMDRSEDAVRDFKEYVVRFYADPEGHYNLGVAYVELGVFAKAIESLTKAIDLHSKDPDMFELRAKAYTEIGEATKAEADLKRARELAAPSE